MVWLVELIFPLRLQKSFPQTQVSAEEAMFYRSVVCVSQMLQFSDQLVFMSSTIITECAVLDGDARLQRLPKFALTLKCMLIFCKCFPLVCGLDCGFDKNLCSWNQMITDAFDWTWQSGSTPTLMTGPTADHSGGNTPSHYVTYI